MQKQNPDGSRPRVLFDGCPLCGAKSWRELRTADCTKHPLYKAVVPKKMRWLECSACKHVYTDGYFSDDVLAIIFAKTQENQMPGFQIEEQRSVSARIVERIAANASIGKWLDVGFGNGSLLMTAQEWGFDPVGLDLRTSSVAALKKLGLAAICADIAELQPLDGVTVVSMADVLEHMPAPAKGLQSAYSQLQDGGILFVSMPHYDCATWRLLDTQNANPYWMEIEHYHNFSRPRLYDLLRENGFEPLCYSVSERYRMCMEVIARRI